MEAFTPLQKGTPNWHSRYNADFTAVHTGLNAKASMEYVQEQISNVPETPKMQEALDKKSDLTYVDAELAKKADAAALPAKADKTYVDTELAKKADATALTAAVGDLTTKLAAKASVDHNHNAVYASKATETTASSAQAVANAALSRAGGTMTGILTASSNGSYTTRQVRNIIQYPNTGISTSPGDVFHVYK